MLSMWATKIFIFFPWKNNFQFLQLLIKKITFYGGGIFRPICIKSRKRLKIFLMPSNPLQLKLVIRLAMKH